MPKNWNPRNKHAQMEIVVGDISQAIKPQHIPSE